MDRYAVFGHPIDHSLSPRIHQLFAAQTGEVIEYRAIDAPPAVFAQRAREFCSSGGRGFNVTVPCKGLAAQLVGECDAMAQRAGAVNTVVVGKAGVLSGYNTDGPGLVRDLTVNLGVRLAGRRILLLGAGGAAAGVLGALLDQRPAQLTIANRTAARAQSLVERFAMPGVLSAVALAALRRAQSIRQFDLVINATAASLAGERLDLPPGLLGPGAMAYDLMYAPEPTPFMQWARRRGTDVAVVDGIGMLVEQAAEAFALWRGRRPQTAPVLAQLAARH